MPFNLDPNATTDPADPIPTSEGAGGMGPGDDLDRGDTASDDVEATIISADSISHATEGSDDT